MSPRRGPRRGGGGRALRIVVAACALHGLLPGSAAGLPQLPTDPVDPTGTAVPYPRIHLRSDPRPDLPGTTGHLRAHDPFLLYQLGRHLVHRQFRPEEGAYGRAGAMDAPLYGTPSAPPGPARFATDHANACGLCHSAPYGEPGGGQTIGSTSSRGRNTPHFFGAGLVEMIGGKIRSVLLHRYDADGDGLLSPEEVPAPAPATVSPAPGAPPVDFGDLAPGADGVPRLNPVFRIWYADADGCVVPGASSVNDPGVEAYGFAVQVFGWGRGYLADGEGRRIPQGAEASTLREIFTTAADLHMGLEAFDPVQRSVRPACPSGSGVVAGTSLSGAVQFDLGALVDRGPAAGGHRSPADPDGDGVVTELTAGDLDAVEFYLLHAPAPASTAPDSLERAGRRALRDAGCTGCHVESWRIPGAEDGVGSGDRRLFALRVESRDGVPGAPGVRSLRGRLVDLRPGASDGHRPAAGGEVRVDGVYSDFRHWDIGRRFHERRYDGTVQRYHRTAPLWGAGSTAPYGHDGSFPTLDAVIRAHGGPAGPAREAYEALPPGERHALVGYLRSLSLYPPHGIPADVDGDGAIADTFAVGGADVGYERFDPEYLFAVDPRYYVVHHVVDPHGRRRALRLLTNVGAAYGLDRAYRVDADGDGFPDREPPGRGGEEGREGR